MLNVDAKVVELFYPNTMHRSIPRVDKIFEQEKAEAIKKIPLSNYIRPDRLIWKDTTYGKFSVRSAYRLHSELMNQVKGQPLSNTGVNRIWEIIGK